MTDSCLYDVVVTHRRLRPKRHALRYRVFYLLLDLDELPALTQCLRLFSSGGRGAASFRQADHGGGEPGGLRTWVESRLDDAGMALPGCRIRLLCMPRVLGHAFNPLAVYFCHRPGGTLHAVLYQVSNTFGQRHTYVMPPGGEGDVLHHRCSKVFYVSPFMPMEMAYEFRVLCPGERMSVAITGTGADGPLIHAAMAGVRRPLTDRTLLAAILRMPLMGAKVVAGIHWEALLLWLKGMRLQPRPEPPPRPATVGSGGPA